jgi:hypothetical protein
MRPRIRASEASRANGAIPMGSEKNEDTRRSWVRPELKSQSTLTAVTQVGSPVPMSLLFFQQSGQCFDSHGNHVPCP